MGVAVVIAPQGEPITLDEARAHIVDPPAADNGLIKGYVAAARAAFERETNRSLMPRTLRLDIDRFPYPRGEIRLPFGPVSGISSISYFDTNGAVAAVDLADCIIDLTLDVPRIIPALHFWWPFTYRRPGAVSVTYTTGYLSSDQADADGAADIDNEAGAPSGAEAIPPDIKACLMLMIGDMYGNRVSVIDGRFGVADVPTAALSIIEGYRIRLLA